MMKRDSQCILTPGGEGVDDSPAILDAFKQCGHNGHIVFQNTTYHIEKVMNTTGLVNCVVDIKGTLLVGGSYVMFAMRILIGSLRVNQTSAWFLGGTNLTVQGFGYGTFDGNGQAHALVSCLSPGPRSRYDYTKGVSNLAGRPHALTIWGAKNSLFQGLRFVQSQMWTMTVAHSEDVLLENIFVSSRSSNSNPARNTDGADTLASNRITFRGWEIDNGDDSIGTACWFWAYCCLSLTHLEYVDSPQSQFDEYFDGEYGLERRFRNRYGFHRYGCRDSSPGVTHWHSPGQYLGIYEYIENVVARNITCIGTRYAGYIKTWTGIQQNYPPNGGGGGTGVVRNIS
ncbi:hypothetical protein FRC10_002990 [Ceratobasidium sp. 414]|nr:hypothetical protein FRC10_002990 [Ceratobasidium sp. 414]